MGAPEYAEFLALVEAHENTRLDTTMVFTEFFDAEAPYPDDLLPRLADLGDRVLLGSDFPTIPYPYREQLDGLTRLSRASSRAGRGLAASGLLAQRRGAVRLGAGMSVSPTVFPGRLTGRTTQEGLIGFDWGR